MSGGRIFISYHRKDAAADANALYQSLRAEFGENRLFKDVDNVPLGANWKNAVRDAVRESSVVLAVMGPSWRFSGAIRIEIETALEEGIPIIPLLMDGARMEDLVGEIEGEAAVIGDLNAAAVDHASWNRDLIPVVVALRGVVGDTNIGDDRAEALVVEPSTSDEAWSAELTEFEGEVVTRFVLNVSLSSRSFEVGWKTGWVRNTVVVDGEVVSSRTAVSSKEIHVFKIDDGGVERTAVLDIRGAIEIQSISLVVDGRALLDMSKPFEVEPPD